MKEFRPWKTRAERDFRFPGRCLISSSTTILEQGPLIPTSRARRWWREIDLALIRGHAVDMIPCLDISRFDREKRELQPSDPLRGVPHYFYHELEPAAAPQNLARAVHVNAVAACFIPKRIPGHVSFPPECELRTFASVISGIWLFHIAKSRFPEILQLQLRLVCDKFDPCRSSGDLFARKEMRRVQFTSTIFIKMDI